MFRESWKVERNWKTIHEITRSELQQTLFRVRVIFVDRFSSCSVKRWMIHFEG